MSLMEDVRVYYEDHVPSHEWLREEGADTLSVHVPGTHLFFYSRLSTRFRICYKQKEVIFLRFQKGGPQGYHLRGRKTSRQRGAPAADLSEEVETLSRGVPAAREMQRGANRKQT